MRIFYPFLMKVVAEGIPIYSQERNGAPYKRSVAPEVEPLPFPGRHSSIIVSEHAEQPPARPRTEPLSQIELDWLRHGATLRLHSSAWPVTQFVSVDAVSGGYQLRWSKTAGVTGGKRSGGSIWISASGTVVHGAARFRCPKWIGRGVSESLFFSVVMGADQLDLEADDEPTVLKWTSCLSRLVAALPRLNGIDNYALFAPARATEPVDAPIAPPSGTLSAARNAPSPSVGAAPADLPRFPVHTDALGFGAGGNGARPLPLSVLCKLGGVYLEVGSLGTEASEVVLEQNLDLLTVLSGSEERGLQELVVDDYGSIRTREAEGPGEEADASTMLRGEVDLQTGDINWTDKVRWIKLPADEQVRDHKARVCDDATRPPCDGS